MQKSLWAGWLLGWVRSSDKEICPSYLTHVGEGGANKENWFVSMKFHRSLPKLWTKKMETGLGVQRARGWGKIAGWTLIEPNGKLDLNLN